VKKRAARFPRPTLAVPPLLVAIAATGGSLTFGAALFAAYWLGRALPVWLSPLVLQNAAGPPSLIRAVYGYRALFQHIHGAAVFSVMVIVLGKTWQF
jgi:cytochrome c biogenesis protein CcdA